MISFDFTLIDVKHGKDPKSRHVKNKRIHCAGGRGFKACPALMRYNVTEICCFIDDITFGDCAALTTSKLIAEPIFNTS